MTATEEVVELELALAGRQVRARIVGRELAARTLRPFSHLGANGRTGTPALTVDLRDEALTGRVRRRTRSARVRSSADASWVARADSSSLLTLDRVRGRIRGSIADGRRVPADQLAKPLPVVLPLWYLDRSVGVVHAAAVADERGAVLLAGAAGAGKSTAGLACAAAGYAFLADDQVGLERDGDSFIAHSLYSTARLEAGHLGRHAELSCGAPVEDVRDDKLLLFVGESASVRLSRSQPVRALALLGPERHAATRRVSGSEALLALAPTSLLGVVGGGHWGLRLLGELVERVPRFRLATSDPDRLPSLVSAMLDGT